MGTSTDAQCFACGYDAFLLLGAGMINFQTYAAWPISCRNCAAITAANFLAVPLACEECKSQEVVPVSDRREWKADGEVIETWDELSLTDGHYRCPKCDMYELRFGTNQGGHDKIMWD